MKRASCPGPSPAWVRAALGTSNSEEGRGSRRLPSGEGVLRGLPSCRAGRGLWAEPPWARSPRGVGAVGTVRPEPGRSPGADAATQSPHGSPCFWSENKFVAPKGCPEAGNLEAAVLQEPLKSAPAAGFRLSSPFRAPSPLARGSRRRVSLRCSPGLRAPSCSHRRGRRTGAEM